MTPPADPPVIFLMGPTAAGKTALALALHDVLPVDIISVDSSQVYRGMDIGTAKPTRKEQRRAPHRLIDIRDPAESYSAADFREDALREMAAITAVGRIPLLVGGTMFYFHALEDGLSELPSADTEVRQILSQEAEHLGWPALHTRLQQHDPETAERIHPNDAQRIQRALEIIEITGQAPSALARQTPPRSLPYRLVKIAIFPTDRGQLHEKIAHRFESMFELGLVAEVEALKRRGDLSLLNPSVRTVGYRQIWEYLTGQVDCYEMVQRGIAATRQFAKRQLTWLRHYQGVTSFDSEGEGLIRQCKDFVRRRTAL